MTPAKPVLTPENKPQPKPTKDVKKKVPKKGKIKRLKKYIAEAQVGKVLTIIPKSQLIIFPPLSPSLQSQFSFISWPSATSKVTPSNFHNSPTEIPFKIIPQLSSSTSFASTAT